VSNGNSGKVKRFEAKWLHEVSFRDVVEQAWQRAGQEVLDTGVHAKLDHLHSSLHAWDHDFLKKPKRHIRTA
jgi:hypothetical protein